MKEVSISQFIEENRSVSSFKVSGFNLVVKTDDGSDVIIPNGVTDILLENISLPTSDGATLNFEKILASIPNAGTGFDSVYLEDMFNTGFEGEGKAEGQEDLLNVEIEDRYTQLMKLLEKIENDIKNKQTELEEKEKEIEESERTQEEIAERKEQLRLQEEQLDEELRKLDAAKAEIEEKTAAEQQRENQNTKPEEYVPPTPAAPTAPPPSSSDSSSSESTPELPDIEIPENALSQFFVSGGLDKESDTGTLGDGYTYISKPTFSGKALPDTSVTLTINGTAYTIKADENGDWSFELPSALTDGSYEYSISVSNEAGESDSVEGTIVIDATVPTISATEWYNKDVDVNNMVNENRPTLTGMTAPNATVYLEINGKTYKTIANDKGEWTMIVSTPLPDGEFDYTIKTETKAGNTSSSTGTVEVDTSIDTTYFLLDAESDSGVANDFVTSNTTPKLTGVTEPGATVVITVNGVEYSLIADANGKWEQTLNELPDGSFDITIDITDKAGNTLQQVGNITIDTTAPETSVAIAKEDGTPTTSGYTNDLTPTISGKTEPNSSVTITLNGVDYTVKADANGDWSFTVSEALAEEKHEYSIVVTDPAGNVSDAFEGSFIVSATPPATPSAGLDALSDSGELNDNITNQESPFLSGKGDPGTLIVITFSDGSVFEAMVNKNGEWRVNVGPFEDGDYTYEVYAENPSGAQSPVVSGELKVDTFVPELTGGFDHNESTDTGAAFDDGITNNNRPTFSGTATDGYTVIVTINGKAYEVEVINGEWSFTAPELADGSYNYSVSITTPAGNSQALDGNFTIDTLDPTTVVMVSREDGGVADNGFTDDLEPVLSGKTDANAELVITFNGQTTTIYADALGNWSIPVGDIPGVVIPLSEGRYEYDIAITDPAGNKTEPSIDGVITVNTSGMPAMPEVELNEASDSGELGDDITYHISPTLSGTAEPNTTVVIRFENGATYRVEVGESGTWSQSVGPFEDGTHGYTVHVESGGNTSSLVEKELTINSLKPSLSGGLDFDSDQGLDSTDGITNVNKPTFSGTINAGLTVIVTINGKEYHATVTDVEGQDTSNWSVTIDPALPDGEYHYTISSTTNAGMTTTTTGNFTVDTVIADTTIDVGMEDYSASENGYTDTTTPLISGTTDAFAKVEITLSNGESKVIYADENGYWKYPVVGPLSEGNYTYSVTVTDVAGNIAPAIDGNFTVITTPPTNPVVSLDSASDSGVAGDNITNKPNPVLSGTGQVGSIITISLSDENGNSVGSFEVEVDEFGNWSQEIGPLPLDGVYDYEIIATDQAGNQSDKVNGSVELDTFKPELSGGLDEAVVDSDDTQYDNTGMPSFSGTVTAGLGLSVIVTINGQPYPAIVNDATGEWSITIMPALSDASYDYTISVTTAAGNSNSLTGSFVVDTVAADTTVDLGMSDGSASENGYTNTKNPTLSGNTDAGSKVVITITNADGTVESETVYADANGNWSHTLITELGESNYSYSVVVTDPAGNESDPVTGSFDVKVTAPAQPEASLSENSDTGVKDDSTTNQISPTLSGSAEAGSTVVITFSNGLEYRVPVDENGAWSVAVGPFTDGSYTYDVVAVDPAGNTSEALTGNNLIVDSSVPELTGGFDLASDDATPATGEGEDIVYNNTGTPSFSGTVTPGLSVIVTINGKEYLATVEHVDGEALATWKVDISPALPDNDYVYTVTTTTAAGNSTTLGGSFTVDTTIATTEVNLGMDDGSISDNGYTDTVRPTLSGNTDAGSKIVITISNADGTLETTTIYADDTGAWSHLLEVKLSEGDYSYSVVVTDPAGNEAPAVEGDFTIITTAPSTPVVNLDSASDTGITGDNLTNKPNPTLSGTGQVGSTITLIVTDVNGDTVGSFEVVVDEFGNWSQEIGPLPDDGVYNYEVSATDPAGNTSSTVTGSVELDTFEASLTGGLSLDNGLSDSDGIIRDNTPSFSGTVSAGLGLAVIVTINGQPYPAIVDDANGTWSVDISPALDDGYYDYTISVTTPAGTTTEIPGNITVDTVQAQTEVNLGMADGSDSNNGYTNTKTPTLSGNTEAGAKVEITITNADGTVETKTVYANEKGDWSYTLLTQLGEQGYSYSVKVTDLAGNESAPVTGNFNVITTPPTTPTVALDEASDTGTVGDNLTHKENPVLTGTGQVGSIITLTVKDANGDIIDSFNITIGASGKWSQEIGPLPSDGTYNYELVATDAAGNTSETASGSVELDTFVPELTASLNAQEVNGTHYAGTSPTFSGTVSEGYSVVVTINGKDYPALVNGTSWTILIDPALDNDVYDYTVSVTTDSGVREEITGSFTVDTVVESTNVGVLESDDSGIVGDDITNNTRPTLTGQAEPGATVIVTFGGQDYPATVDENGVWTFPYPAGLQDLTDAVYDFTITITDEAGNTDSSTHTFEVDTTAKNEVSLSNLDVLPGYDGGSTTSESRPTFTGSAEPGSTVQFVFGENTYNVQVKDDGTWEFRLPVVVTDETTHAYQVVVTDPTGNTNTFDGEFTYVLDDTKPPRGSVGLEGPTVDENGEVTAEGSDSGKLGDMITNNTRPVIVGYIAPGCTAVLTINGVEYILTDEHINEDGSYRFELPDGVDLNEGTNVYELVVTNPETQLTGSVSGEIVVDTIMPDISESNFVLDTNTGATNDYATQTRVNSFSGKIEPGASIVMHINGKDYHGVVDGQGNYVLNVPDSLADGNYPFTVTVTDKAGNESSFTDNLIVDNVRESWKVTWQEHGGSAGGRFTFDSTEFGVLVENSVDPNATITLTYNGVTITGKVNEPLFFPEGTFEKGQFYSATMTLTMTDSAGNTSSQSWNNIQMIDNSNMEITGGLTEESDTDTVGDKITSDTTPDFSGAFDCITSASMAYTGKITINGKEFPITITLGTNTATWSFEWPENEPALPPGYHPYTVTITETYSGNSFTAEDSITVNSLDMWLSAATDTGEFGDYVTAHDEPVLEGKAAEGALVRVFFNGRWYEGGTDFTLNADGTWVFPLPGAPLNDGSYDIKVSESINGVSTTIDRTIVIATKVPETDVNFDEDDIAVPETGLVSTANPTLSGTTDPFASIELILSGRDPITVTAGADGKWEITLSDLADGDYNYTLHVTSQTGIAGPSHQGSFEVMADLDWSFVSLVDGSVNGAEQEVTEGGSRYTNNGVLSGEGKPGATVSITVDGKGPLQTIVAEDGTWSIDASSLYWTHNHNAHYPESYITITDPVSGAEQTLQFTTRFDLYVGSNANSAPAWINMHSSSGVGAGGAAGMITHDDTPSFYGRINTQHANLVITLTINGKEYTTQTDSKGYWTIHTDEVLEDGTYDITYTLSDLVGNVSPNVGQSSVTISTAKPQIDAMLDSEDDSNVVGDLITNIPDQVLSGSLGADEVMVLRLNQIVVQPTMNEDGTWSYPMNGLADGSYELNITVTSASGVQTTKIINFVIDTNIDPVTAGLDAASDTGDVGDDTTNMTRPSFSGTTEAGATVTFVITVNGTEHTYVVTANSTGKWIVPMDFDLPPGTWSYSVTAKDKAGNETETATTGSVTIASADGTETSVTANVGGIDDGVITQKQPSFSGVASDSTSGALLVGVTIQVVIDGKTYTAVTNANGEWLLNVDTDLADGNHDYTVNVLDSAGNVTGSTSGKLEIDTMVDFEVDGLRDENDIVRPDFINSATPTFVGTGEAGSTIQLVINGQVMDAEVLPDGTWSVTVDNALNDGNYNYTITVTDPHGNTTDASGNITVETGVPTELTGGLDSDSQLGNHAGVADTNTPMFSGSTEAGATVTITIGGHTFSAVANASGYWEITCSSAQMPSLADGKYDYEISMTDKAGNEIETPLSGSVVIAANPPVADATLSAGSDTGNLGDNITSNTMPTLTGLTRPGSTVIITFPGEPPVMKQVIADADGNWSYTLEHELSAGDNNFTVSVTDPYGGSNIANGNIIIAPVLDSEFGLTLGSDTGTVGDNITSDTAPVIEGKTNVGATITITMAGVNGGEPFNIPVNGDGTWQFSFADHLGILDEGTYHYTITATDEYGQITSTEASFSVDPVAPDAVLSVNVAALGNDTSPAFSGTGAEVGSKVIVTLNGKEYPTLVDLNGNWMIDWSQVDEADLLGTGTYTYSVVVEDVAGNQSTPATGSFDVDVTAPDMVTSVNVAALGNDPTPEFSGTGAEAGSTVTVNINGIDYPTIVLPNGDWSIDWASVPTENYLGHGTNSYFVTVTDALGNTSDPYMGSFDIDTVAPNAPSVNFPAEVNSETPELSGTGAEAGSTVIVTINGKNYPTIVQANGDWTVDWANVPVEDHLAHSAYTYSVVVVDAAGNASAPVSGELKVDLGAPVMVESIEEMPIAESNTTPSFTGRAVAGTGVLLMINDKFYQTTADENESWSISIPANEALSDGEYTYSVVLSDEDGNEEFSQHIFNTAGDVAANDAQASTEYTHFEGVTLAGANVSLEIDGKLYSTQANELGEWQIETELSDSSLNHAYSLSAELDGELISQKSGVTNLESNDTMEASYADTAQGDSHDDLVFEGELPANTNEIRVEFNGESVEVSYSEDKSTWSATVPSTLIEENNHYKVSAIDKAGNETVLASAEHAQPQHEQYTVASETYTANGVEFVPELTFSEDQPQEEY